ELSALHELVAVEEALRAEAGRRYLAEALNDGKRLDPLRTGEKHRVVIEIRGRAANAEEDLVVVEDGSPRDSTDEAAPEVRWPLEEIGDVDELLPRRGR